MYRISPYLTDPFWGADYRGRIVIIYKENGCPEAKMLVFCRFNLYIINSKIINSLIFPRKKAYYM